MTELGRFAESFANWRRLIASVPSIDDKAVIFGNMAREAAVYVAKGLDRSTAVDELHDAAVAHGLVQARGEDSVQVVISDAFMLAEYGAADEVLPEPPLQQGRHTGAQNGKQAPLPPITSKAQFLERYGKPPNYLVDDMLIQGFIYALTGQTGHCKTAVALLIARLVASSEPNALLGNRKVTKGRVIYFVGENPDDVALRIKGSDAVRADRPDDDNIWFIPGIFDIERMLGALAADMARNGPAALIIVDTSAAYFLGNEELSNTQMGAYARLLRKLTALPGNPCVLVLCHPVKHVTEPTQLLPRGGSAYLAEMDGNLTLWKTADDTAELYFTKLRGPSMQPVTFQLKPIRTPKLLDAKGRQMATIEAVVISSKEEDAAVGRQTQEEDQVLAAMLKQPDGSFAVWATDLEWVDGKGEPYRKRVERVIGRLAAAKPRLVVKRRSIWELTDEGKTQARKAAQRFQAEVDTGRQSSMF